MADGISIKGRVWYREQGKEGVYVSREEGDAKKGGARTPTLLPQYHIQQCHTAASHATALL